jgi:cytochrome c
MDSFEWNKVIGAVLMTLLITTVIGHAGDILVPEPEAGHHVKIEGAAASAQPTQEAAAPAAIQPIAPFLTKANLDQGKSAAKVCTTCHTLAKGEPARIGPNLWGIVGNKRAHQEGFAYSDAIKKLGGTWDFDELNKFLAKPQAYAPGTKMTFAGLPDEQKRADVIAYLNSLSDNPQPLPK